MDTLGWVYYKKGLYDSAINEFSDSLAKIPDNAIVHYQWTHEETIHEPNTLNGSFIVFCPFESGKYYLSITLYYAFEEGTRLVFTKELGIQVDFSPDELGLSVSNNSVVYSDQQIYFWANKYNGTFKYSWDGGTEHSSSN